MITLAPWWWLLAAAALLSWIGPWRGRNLPQNLLRSALFLSLAAGLSRPHLKRDDAPPQRVLIVDQSDSVDPSVGDHVLQQTVVFARQDSDSLNHLVAIGWADDETLAQWNENFDSVTLLGSSGPSGTTPLSAALAHAETRIGRTSRGSVMLVSDGLTTREDDARAIASLRQREIPIDVVPLPIAPMLPTPVAISWREPLRVGSSAIIDVTIVAHQAQSSGKVLLRTADGVLASAQFDDPKARVVMPLELEPSQAGFIDAEVVVTLPGDSEVEEVLPVVLPVDQPHRVFYLGGLQESGAQQLSRLLGGGFELIAANLKDGKFSFSPENESDNGRSASSCDLVLMDDCYADSVSPQMEQQLIDAVTDEGLGLVMSGGRGSFGAGGWHDRPIEKLLPVELVQKEEKRDPSTSLVIVIDTSGSMTGVRVQLAKEVARLAMRRLLPHDKVGIVEFYGAKRWAAPIQPASNAIELQRALNRMDAGGGTVILPALEEAFYGLQNVDTRYKHVLVLTDGGVESGDFESLMRRMAAEGINVSTVLAGGGYHSEFLVNIANWGKGRFYNVPNRFNLPEILLKQPSTAKLPSYRPGAHRVRARGGSGWWGDVDMSMVPELAGYVESKPRSGSEVLLETEADGHPVLSTWRYGLGRVTTFGSEPVGEGTRPWRNWGDYGKALARVMERTAADSRDPFRFQCVHDGGELVVHAIRQRPRSGTMSDPVPVARLAGDDIGSDEGELTFVARSPDRFVAKIPAAPPGETLRLECSASSTPGRLQRLTAASPVVDELRVDPAHGIDLPSLAVAAGGKVIDFDKDWIGSAAPQLGGKRLTSLAPWLLGLALMIFLVEIVWRRRPKLAPARYASKARSQEVTSG